MRFSGHNEITAFAAPLPDGYVLHRYDKTTSTQTLLKEHCAKDIHSNHVVVAAMQTQGRGRYKREWESMEGNLHCSWSDAHDNAGELVATIPYLVALSIKDVLHEKAIACGFKWPNDIMVNGKKCGGILIESGVLSANKRIFYIGLGLNLMHAPKQALYPATSLKQEGYKALEIDAVVPAILYAYAVWKDFLQQNGRLAVYETWLQECVHAGKLTSVRNEKVEYKGIMRGLNEEGSMLLEDMYGSIKTIRTGDVFPINDKGNE